MAGSGLTLVLIPKVRKSFESGPSGAGHHSSKSATSIAVMLAGVGSILLVPLIHRLWVIIVLLAFIRPLGLLGSAPNYALVSDLVRSRTHLGKVTAIT